MTPKTLEQIEKKKAYDKARYEKSREEVKARRRDRYAKEPDREKTYAKEYYKENKMRGES
jgi:hypothetical protein